MLLGNKSDLHNLRDVAEESASIKAEELGIPYLETSALALVAVSAVMACVAESALNAYPAGVIRWSGDSWRNGPPASAENQIRSTTFSLLLKREEGMGEVIPGTAVSPSRTA